MENNSSRSLIMGIVAVAIVLLLAGAVMLYLGLTTDPTSDETTVAEATADIDAIVAETVAAMSQAATEAADLLATQTSENVAVESDSAAADEVPPTFTAVATEIPTDTPVPTDTPIPTDTPVPTNTPVPIIPTNTPVPIIPTNTPAPPTATSPPPGPQPGNHNGLVGVHFAILHDRTSAVVNGEIWYEWTVGNTTSGHVPYSTIGVMPRKDGVDRVQWYQNNWGGNNDSMPPEGLSWPSWLSVPERGQYTLRVVVCFDGFQACMNGQGTFHTLSPEIPITIN